VSHVWIALWLFLGMTISWIVIVVCYAVSRSRQWTRTIEQRKREVARHLRPHHSRRYLRVRTAVLLALSFAMVWVVVALW
jgi:hypothetical protein